MEFFTQHPFATAAAFWIFMAAVDAMPEPQSATGFYAWLYRFGHLLAANLSRAGKKR